jgi:hypothetical protein
VDLILTSPRMRGRADYHLVAFGRVAVLTPRPALPFALISLRKGVSRTLCFEVTGEARVGVEALQSNSALACLRRSISASRAVSLLLMVFIDPPGRFIARRLRLVDEREGTSSLRTQKSFQVRAGLQLAVGCKAKWLRAEGRILPHCIF